MPVLTQACTFEKNPTIPKQYSEVLFRISKLCLEAEELTGTPISTKDAVGLSLRQKEESIISEVFDKYLTIPNTYTVSSIKDYRNGSWGKEYLEDHTFKEAYFCEIPKTKIGQLTAIADTLNMVILPIEYVKIEEIIDSVEDDYYKRMNIKGSVKNFLFKMKDGFHSYILCPLSFYNVWEEVKDTEIRAKYYPSSMETIFTTLDLMIPAQRNLWQMSKTNAENTKALAVNLEDNIKLINARMSQMENRISKVEKQLEQIARAEKERKAQEERVRMARLRQAQEIQLSYRSLDPIVFSVKGDEPDFFNQDELSRKAMLGACFGPEFPVEFFNMNGLTIVRKKFNPSSSGIA